MRQSLENPVYFNLPKNGQFEVFYFGVQVFNLHQFCSSEQWLLIMRYQSRCQFFTHRFVLRQSLENEPFLKNEVFLSIWRSVYRKASPRSIHVWHGNKETLVTNLPWFGYGNRIMLFSIGLTARETWKPEEVLLLWTFVVFQKLGNKKEACEKPRISTAKTKRFRFLWLRGQKTLNSIFLAREKSILKLFVKFL